MSVPTPPFSPHYLSGSDCPVVATLWLVVCACGWTRECSSEWAANSVSRLHRQLARAGVEHVTRVESPDDSVGWPQLTLT